jgi:hypothetical protein
MGRDTDGVMKSTENNRGGVTVDIVINNFSGLEPYIRRSYREDGDFRSLCEDFAVCALALRNIKSTDAPTNRRRCKEYEQLLAELKQEIENWLLDRYLPEHQGHTKTGSTD